MTKIIKWLKEHRLVTDIITLGTAELYRGARFILKKIDEWLVTRATGW